MKKELAVVIDLSTLMYRSLYSKTDSDKKNPVARKSLRYILNIIEEFSPNYLVLALDDERDNIYRKKLDPKYKSNRKNRPQEIEEGLKVILEFCDMFNIKYVKVVSNEADDVIATLIKKFTTSNIYSIVVTQDGDLCQLHSKVCKIAVPTRNSIKVLRSWKQVKNHFKNKILVDSPDQLRDYLSLVGDGSDNIKGATGVGKNRAVTLLNKYGSINNMYNSKDDLPYKLREQKETVYKSRNLIKLYDKLVIPKISEYKYGKFDYHKALSWMDRHGLANNLFNEIIDLDF